MSRERVVGFRNKAGISGNAAHPNSRQGRGEERSEVGHIGSGTTALMRNGKIYPNEESALKLVFMAIRKASKKWSKPIHHWKEALNHFAVLYEGRMPELTNN
jgi:hypothetical protein